MMTRDTYNSIRDALIAEKRRLPMFRNRRFRLAAQIAYDILMTCPPLPKLEPAWAYQIYIDGEYEGTTQSEEEASEHKAQGHKIKLVPSLYAGNRPVRGDLEWHAMKARECLEKAKTTMRAA